MTSRAAGLLRTPRFSKLSRTSLRLANLRSRPILTSFFVVLCVAALTWSLVANRLIQGISVTTTRLSAAERIADARPAPARNANEPPESETDGHMDAATNRKQVTFGDLEPGSVTGPDILCRTSEMQPADGSGEPWTMCTPPSLTNGLVYTIGVGRNIQWDKAVMSKFNTSHLGWDPTPRSASYFKENPDKLPNQFVLNTFGLGVSDGFVEVELPAENTDSFVPSAIDIPGSRGSSRKTSIPVLTLQSMVSRSGHEGLLLQIVKIDIEGAELDVVRSWVEAKWRPPAYQILLEDHRRYFDGQKGETFFRDLVDGMTKVGFTLFHTRAREHVFVRDDSLLVGY